MITKKSDQKMKVFKIRDVSVFWRARIGFGVRVYGRLMRDQKELK